MTDSKYTVVDSLIVCGARLAVGYAETFARVLGHGLATALAATQYARTGVEHQTIRLHQTPPPTTRYAWHALATRSN